MENVKDKLYNVLVFVKEENIRDCQAFMPHPGCGGDTDDFSEEEDFWFDLHGPVLVAEFYHITVDKAKSRIKDLYPDTDPNVFEYRIFPTHITDQSE